MDRSRVAIESLEARQLFAGVSLSGKSLIVNGQSNLPNTITVGLTPGGQSVIATVVYQTLAGVQTKSGVFLVGQLKNVHINGGAKNDLITIDQTDGSFPLSTTILAGSGNDTVYGGDEPDVIRGNAGNDFIDAGAGNDKVVGGYGNDTLIGGLGDDTLRGNMGHDYENGGEGDDRLIDFGSKQTLIGGDGVDRFVVQGIKRDTSDYDKTIDKITRVAFPSNSESFLDALGLGFL